MKRTIIFAVAAFLVSLGGTTTVLVKRGVAAARAVATANPAEADSVPALPTPADSMAPASTPRDSTPADTTRRDSTRARVVADSAPPTPARIAVVLKPVAVPTPSGPAPVDPEDRAAAYKQVARVLSAMKPPEAAKVLLLLSDDEVEGILRSVGPRQAADFLTNLPKERAAQLSRRLLVPKAKDQTR